ncbi:ABC transporter ATP-binding protein [Actinoplanes solisilvae]|uniref:ABC transporter ATP-binding protein n=1 Tax=Actinoplanes solisilvae TaxID=2486853 RepID=UPI000FDACAE6|nr:ABC transporter ATP-binding protein [Actinoplanes solisilvae]
MSGGRTAEAATEPPEVAPALVADGLSKRYSRTYALRDCSFTVPAGRVAALVGPNGAGKSTLLQIAVGLLTPTAGSVSVFGVPMRQTAEALSRIAFLAQDKPLYHDFTVTEMLRFGRAMNPRWNNDLARRRIEELGLPFDRKVGKLSGGQQTQVALALAVAKQPDLLILDEPLADLDPLARDDVTRTLMASVAETGMTVLLSSHVVSELEGTCDWLVVLNGGRVQVSGDIEELLAQHRMCTGAADEMDDLAAGHTVISRSTKGRQATLMIRSEEPPADPRWTTAAVNLEDIVLTYLRNPDTVALLDRPVPLAR